MFESIKNIFAPKVLVPVAKNWRTGMWVIYQTKPVILHKMGPQMEVHLVDEKSGETHGVAFVEASTLRQATYDEIPAIRRNITREQAKDLGYGS
jgi:hypothetical protein